MDELMSRFMLNLKRDKLKDTFAEFKQVLEKQDLRQEKEEEVKTGVEVTMNALQSLMFEPTIKSERLGNT